MLSAGQRIHRKPRLGGKQGGVKQSLSTSAVAKASANRALAEAVPCSPVMLTRLDSSNLLTEGESSLSTRERGERINPSALLMSNYRIYFRVWGIFPKPLVLGRGISHYPKQQIMLKKSKQ